MIEIGKPQAKQSSDAFVSGAIDRGLSYLREHQLPNGEFCSYYSPDDQMEQWCVPDSTVFPTSIIVNSLLSLMDRNEVQDIFQKAIPFLKYQRMWQGVWQHFTKWHKLYPVSPPDIDNTIFAYNFLRSQNVKIPDPTPIILANHNKKGLLYTWLTLRLRRNTNKKYLSIVLREIKNPVRSMLFWKTNDCRRNDIDLGVNINVLSFLGEKKETLPIIKYLYDKISDKNIGKHDGWYRNPIILYYLFSRTTKFEIDILKEKNKEIINKILGFANPDGSFGDSHLETSLAVSALINLRHKGKEIRQGISYLVKRQRANGEWDRSVFFYSGPKQAVGWGSEELTTGFCLETLALSRKIFAYDSEN